MLKEISVDTVRPLEVGYSMSDRQAQRLAQTARFAIGRIESSIEKYELTQSEQRRQVIEMERAFVKSYYDNTDTPLHSAPALELPQNILDMYKEGRYIEYAEAVREFRGITVGE